MSAPSGTRTRRLGIGAEFLSQVAPSGGIWFVTINIAVVDWIESLKFCDDLEERGIVDEV